MKIIYIHGINESQADGELLKADWDEMIWGVFRNTSMLYWGDLSIARDGLLQDLGDRLLCEMLKLATANTLLRDVNNYFFKDGMRIEIIARFQKLIESNPEDDVLIVSHSWGTVIAYDSLYFFDKVWKETLPNMRINLITIGSPLGLHSIQAQLRSMYSKERLTVPSIVKNWDNYFDSFDPVAAMHLVKPAYKAKHQLEFTDHIVKNPKSPTYAHSLAGYFSTEIKERILNYK